MNPAKALPSTTRRSSAALLTLASALGLGLIATGGHAQEPVWAFEETFDDLNPPGPSQDLLPKTFDFSVTHLIHPKDLDPVLDPYPADHGPDCAGPAPPVPAQHMVHSTNHGNGMHPDESFYVCKRHMMSSMGHVAGYSETSFWPRQEFDFAAGGTLEFDVNINDGHGRSWWEIVIQPRQEMNVAPGLVTDETWPLDHIVFQFDQFSTRKVFLGGPGGEMEDFDWRQWRYIFPDDPALSDRRIRRHMHIQIESHSIVWSIETEDGSLDDFQVDLPDGLPFTRGLVFFTTHAYTPEKDGNTSIYTFHWDNIRFTGPVVGRYDAFESDELVYLESNGPRQIGDSAENTITLDRVGGSPVLFGEVHGGMAGQVLLSINGGPNMVVSQHSNPEPACPGAPGWSSFSMPLNPDWLHAGVNTFHWTVGPRPACAADLWWWDGFSIKGLEIQVDSNDLFRDGFETGDQRRWTMLRPH